MQTIISALLLGAGIYLAGLMIGIGIETGCKRLAEALRMAPFRK